ncbi:hypothetical protein FANTH_9638 [Fusarium anthophilum]|uniref:Uncharacterized protein n=1 Tax=Fusarium anthophilum TaxID=48485 RepID=A0A8H5DYD4_9HYPO|nr:hypothetical protein FANTH_9638 [Fusarium anthophilum]
MKFLSISSLLALTTLASAKLHSQAVCVTNRHYSPSGGTAWSPSYNWKVNYELLPDATNCACAYYRSRNTGNNQWDKCPDCRFDGLVCGSDGWHIGGDEVSTVAYYPQSLSLGLFELLADDESQFTYYCEKKCGAQGAEAN